MMHAFVRALALSAWLVPAALGTVSAQAPASKPIPATPSAATPEGSPAVIVSAETRAIRSRLDTAKLRLDQTEAALARRELSDAELQDLRQQTDPLGQEIRSIVDELQPRADAAKARLDQLGPRPKE